MSSLIINKDNIKIINCPPRCPNGYKCVNKNCVLKQQQAEPQQQQAEPAQAEPAQAEPAQAEQPASKEKIIICPPRCPKGYKCVNKNCITKQQPELPQPELPQPELPQPELPQPELPQPELPQPELQQPELQQEQSQEEEYINNDLDEITSDDIEKSLFITVGNKEKNKNELDEYNQLASLTNTKKFDFLYPNLNDPNFNTKIAVKKEFADTKYDGSIANIETQSELLCNAEFELAPHQKFVKNFLSFQTPYNSLLLYHGLGTGKTCSAISISEEMRDYLMQMGIKNKIIVVASPNVQNNFKLQLFDETKLKEVNGIWNLNICIGNKFLKEINPFNTKGLTRNNIITKIKYLINNYYKFMGYFEFANYINKYSEIEEDVLKNKTPNQIKALIRNKLQKHFNNRLIIIDEVHNIRITDENQNKRVAIELFKLVQNASNIRLLLLSATPMYNSYKEIIWLINLMNINDNRSMIQSKDVFNADGTFKLNKNGEEIGKKTLERKATGYISFVRGENPYTFPYRIWPSEFSKENTFEKYNYPRKQLNGTTIIQGIEILSLFLTHIGPYQQLGYSYILQKIKSNLTDENKSVTFDTMEKFGYTILQKPLEALNIVYPDERLDVIQLNPEEPPVDIDISKKQVSIDIRDLVGKAGLSRIVDYDVDTIRYNFRYKNIDKYGRVFSKNEIGKYSSKIYNICQRIMNSEGVVLVYSQYIDGGIVPIALALEELGFTRAIAPRSLFGTPPTEPIDAITFKSKSESKKAQQPFNPAKYVMITGDKTLTPDSINDIKLLTSDENVDGKQIKVVLISQAASEGVDLKFIRQVHILDPWYNMNRIEQIIGRAIRNCSHKKLPFTKRNVELYLYGTLLNDMNEEAVDLYIYRFAELKSIQIGYVSRVLKEISVDCILNYAQTNFVTENMIKNNIPPVKLNLSSNKQSIMYNIGDKSYSATCDYMKKCMYTCLPSSVSIKEEDIKKDTYNLQYIIMGSEKIIQRIKDLFKEKFFYNKNEIIKHISSIKSYPIDNINYALYNLVNDKYEYITDKYGRLGNIINIGDLYLFQPIELANKQISTYDRSVPIDYKHNEVTITNINEKIKDKRIKEKNIDELLTEIKQKYNIATVSNEVFATIKDVDIKENEWYKSCRNVVLEMLTNKVAKNVIYELIIAHIIEDLQYNNMLLLVNHYSKLKESDEFEKGVKQYIDNTIITSSSKKDSIKLLIVENNGKNDYLVWDETNKKWDMATNEDINDVNKEIKKIKALYAPPQDKLNRYVGFISNFKNKYMVYKIKDIKNKRSKGSRCNQMSFIGVSKATKNDAIEILNSIIISPEKYASGIDVKQSEICCKQELILRLYDKEERLNKKWFISPGIAILINFEND
jgi:hypothetical protein